MTLTQLLNQHLKNHQAMPFAEFMHNALYAPHAGYYSSGLPKLGKEGDFITAPELTPLFGRTLAKQCSQILKTLKAPNLLEYGAGTAKLCVDILKQLEEEHCLPGHYFILEVSANLRHRQFEFIQQQIPHLAHKVIWLDSWPENSFNGIILANEVLDAMPVHRFMLTEQGVMESFITLNDQGELQETYQPSNNQALLEHIQSLQLKTKPYLSEANLFLTDWIARNYQILNQGVMLLIDYGFPRHEYYHPDRNQGTLMCHYKHQAYTNPLLHLGEQDITAHVDFTHVAEAAVKAGFHVAGFTNQASFLLANDLLSLLTSLQTEKELLQAKQAIKQLTHPNEMGELFKVIALSKEVPLALNGFQLQDKRASL